MIPGTAKEWAVPCDHHNDEAEVKANIKSNLYSLTEHGPITPRSGIRGTVRAEEIAVQNGRISWALNL